MSIVEKVMMDSIFVFVPIFVGIGIFFSDSPEYEPYFWFPFIISFVALVDIIIIMLSQRNKSNKVKE